MPALFHHPAVFDHEQSRRLPSVDGRCAMANTVRPATSDRALPDVPLVSVSTRRRLVQDEDPRVMQDRPRDRHPLPLTAGERVSPFAHTVSYPWVSFAMKSCAFAARRRDHLVERGLRRQRMFSTVPWNR